MRLLGRVSSVHMAKIVMKGLPRLVYAQRDACEASLSLGRPEVLQLVFGYAGRGVVPALQLADERRAAGDDDVGGTGGHALRLLLGGLQHRPDALVAGVQGQNPERVRIGATQAGEERHLFRSFLRTRPPVGEVAIDHNVIWELHLQPYCNSGRGRNRSRRPFDT